MRFTWGTLLESADDTAHRPASYDWVGTRYVWDPAVASSSSAALDVERLDTPLVDLAASSSLSHHDFLRAWTRLEVLAKLAEEPILARFRREALVVLEFDVTYRHTEPSGATYVLYSNVWDERQTVFTCGYRVA